MCISDTISIIDYELSGMLFEGYDLAYLFANTPVFDGMGNTKLFNFELFFFFGYFFQVV